MSNLTSKWLNERLAANPQIRCDDHPSPARVPDPKPKKHKASLVGERKGETPGTERPLVRFTLRRVRLLDVDAKWSSVKDLLDGLQYAGLVDGDREDQIRLEVVQERVGKFKEESTQIDVIYP